MTSLKEELGIYKEKYGHADDPLDVLMKTYGIEDAQIDRIQPVVDFYKVLDEILEDLV